MLITRGLGTGLLITLGYGGQAISVYPYCPDVPVILQATQTVAPLAVPYTRTNPYTRTQSVLGGIPSPYVPTSQTVISSTVVIEPTEKPTQASPEVISNTPQSYTELPKHCD